MEEPTKTKPKKSRPPRHAADWSVMIISDSLYITGDYRELAVGLLKAVVPGGARRFYRKVGPEFFSRFALSTAQVAWLEEAHLFNGTWEVLREYRRQVLEALSAAYPEVWLVENGQSRHYQLPVEVQTPDLEAYALGANTVMPLTWARTYSLYCHRHQAWESQPCKDVGLIVERPGTLDRSGSEASVVNPKKKKWPDLELHAPLNTLVRASRQQTSYYRCAPSEPVRLGRDQAGEVAVRRVIDTQRLSLVLRAARVMTVSAGKA